LIYKDYFDMKNIGNYVVLVLRTNSISRKIGVARTLFLNWMMPNIRFHKKECFFRSIVLLLSFFSCIFINAQNTEYWISGSDSGNWWNDGSGSQLHWVITTSGSCQNWWVNRPDQTCPTGTTYQYNYVIFDNNSNLSMSVNGSWFKIYTLTFASAASSARTMTANSGGLDFGKGSASSITNNSSATHVFATGIGMNNSTPLTINASSGGLTFNSGYSIYTNGNAITFTGSFANTVNSIIDGGSGTATLTKDGSGTLILGSTNTYTGITNIKSGILRIANSQALGTTTAGTTVSSGGAIDLNGVNYSNAEALTLNGTGVSSSGVLYNSSSTGATFAGSITLGSASTITGGSGTIALTNTITNGGYALTFNGESGGRISGVISGAGQLIKDGSGILKLSASNTYTNETDINAGELWIEEGGGISNSSGKKIYVGNGGAQTTVAKLWISDLNGGTTLLPDIQVNLGSSGYRYIGGVNTSGTNTYSGSIINKSSGLNLSAYYSGGTTNFAGVISDESANPITIEGSGTIQLSAANTYTGSTTVKVNTLTLGAANALPVGISAGSIQVAGSGTPIINLGNYNLGSGTALANSAGALDIDVNTTFNLGTSNNSYYFKASSGQTWSATTITINNWTGTAGTSGTGSKIYIGSDVTGLTSAQLVKITFNGYSAGAILLSTGELVPKPGNLYFMSKGDVSWTSTTNWLSSDTESGTYTDAILSPSDATISKLTVKAGNILTVSSAVSTPASSAFIVNGILQLNDGGSVSTAPTYGTSSTLQYNQTLATPGVEWTAKATSGTGYPYHVSVLSGSLNMTPATFGNEYYAAGKLKVASGAVFDFNMPHVAVANQGKIVVTFNGSIYNNGTVRFGGGTAGNNQAFQCDSLINNGTFSLSENTAIPAYAIGGDAWITGDYVNNGTFNCNGRAICFTGGKNQKISGTGTEPFAVDFMVVSKTAGILTLEKDITCKGYSSNSGGWWALQLTGGILDLNGHSLVLSAADDGSTYIGSAGILCSGTGAIRGSATSSVTLLGNRSSWTASTGQNIVLDQTTDGMTNVLKKLIINRTDSNNIADKVYVNKVIVNDSLKIKAGQVTIAALTLNKTAVATLPSSVITSSLTITNDLILGKSSSSATEFYRNGRSLTIGGKVRTKVTFDQTGKWHFISFPYTVTNIFKSDGTTAAIWKTDYSLAYYDAAKRATNVSGWTTATSSTMTGGNGYLINKKSALEDLYFDSNVQGGDDMFKSSLTKTLTYTSSTVCDCDAGWNFIAHPMSASAVPTLNQGEFAYSYNAAIDTYKLWYYEKNPAFTSTGNIHPFDAFFVKTPTASTVSLVYNDYANPQGVKSFVSASTEQNLIDLKLDANSVEYETFVRVLSDATIDYDVMYDAPYATPMTSTTPRLYTLIGPDMYSMNSVPEVSEVPVGLRLPASGSYSLSWTTTSPTMPVLLTDRLTSTVTDLSSVDSYSFTSDVSGDINDRFVLNIVKKVITATTDPTDRNLSVLGGNGQIYVKGIGAGDKIYIYDTTGRLFRKINTRETTASVQAAAGVYLIDIRDKNNNNLYRTKVVVCR